MCQNEQVCARKSNLTNEFVWAKIWDMGSAERRKVNVLEIKSLKIFVRVTHIEIVRNEEVCRQA